MKKSTTGKSKFVKLSADRKDLITQLLGMDSQTIVREGVQECIRELLLVLAELAINTEVMEIVGKRYERDGERNCTRWGKQAGSIYLMEQRVPIDKQRVRTKGAGGSEIELKTYEDFNDPKALNEQAGAKLLSGMSTRRFKKGVERMLRGRGIGRQTISRRGMAEMVEKLEHFRKRSLDGVDILVLFIDGIWLGDTVYVAAVGLDSEGKKHVLDFEPGSTESSGVCRELVRSLIERQVVTADGNYLFVLDGGKGLLKAVKEVFGKRAHIQRCIEHKKRNVEEKLPKNMRQEFRHKFAAAYSKHTLKEAEAAFVELRKELVLDRRHAAANSMTEGLQEILTLHRLGITGVLRKSLCTTNCIESVFSAARYYTRNVKRWNGEEQMDRWIAAGLLEAETNLRRVPGYTQINKLKAKLGR